MRKRLEKDGALRGANCEGVAVTMLTALCPQKVGRAF
jgi:hypothetical protein